MFNFSIITNDELNNELNLINQEYCPILRNWKNNYELGAQIQHNYCAYAKAHPKETQFNDDILLIQQEIYSSLRDFYLLPKLRKENFYLENEINSTLQIHMFEFIYDQQELYEYYDEFLDEDQGVLINPTPKNMELPFTSLLTEFKAVKREFRNKKDENDLAQFRWYDYSNILLNNDKYL